MTDRQQPTPEQFVEILRREHQQERTSGFSRSPFHLPSVAIQHALEIDPKERLAVGLKLKVHAPLDSTGRLVTTEASNYAIFLLFPYDRNDYRFLFMYRFSLAQKSTDNPQANPSPETLTHLDELVSNNAELCPELTYEKVNRLMLEIKISDTIIKDELRKAATLIALRNDSHRRVSMVPVTTPTVSKYTDIKSDKIAKYLDAALLLETEYPHLNPLFDTSADETPDKGQTVLYMWHVLNRNLKACLMDPSASFRLQPDESSNFRTNINLHAIGRSKFAYDQGRDSEADRNHVRIAQMLGL